MNFHLALCKLKRFMPNKKEIFDCINFNGGFTTYPAMIYTYIEIANIVK